MPATKKPVKKKATKKELQEIVNWFARAYVQESRKAKDYKDSAETSVEAYQKAVSSGVWSFGFWVPDMPTLVRGIRLPEFRAALGLQPDDIKRIMDAADCNTDI